MTAGCVPFGDAIVCGVGSKPIRRRVLHCPICKRRRRMVEWWGGAWYGPTITCCGCGDAWTDGEMHERPFQRGWRAKSIAKAQRDWDAAHSREDYDAAVRADLAAVFAWQDEHARPAASDGSRAHG